MTNFKGVCTMRTKPYIASIYVVLLSMLLLVPFSGRGASADSLFAAGNALYERNQYDSAIWNYEQILSSGVISDELLYNLGNSYYRIRNYPEAILYYNKVLKRNPRHENARVNLSMANAYCIDKIEPVSQLRIVAWFNRIPSLLTPTTWAVISFILLVLALSLVLVFRFTRSRSIWVQSGVLGLIMLLLSCCTFWVGRVAQHSLNGADEAIIMQSVVSVKGAPDGTSKDLFLLHAGTKVKMLSQIGTWVEVALPNGNQGWLEVSSVAFI